MPIQPEILRVALNNWSDETPSKIVHSFDGKDTKVQGAWAQLVLFGIGNKSDEEIITNTVVCDAVHEIRSRIRKTWVAGDQARPDTEYVDYLNQRIKLILEEYHAR